MYSIVSDKPRRLLTLELTGFWDIDEANAFARDQQRAVRAFGPPFGTHLTLADVSGWPIQSQSVSAIIRDLVVNAGATSKRIALVGGDGLVRMQLKRVVERDGMRMFSSCREAEAWLVSDD